MPAFIDETGNTYTLLKVIKESGRSKNGKVLWECLCLSCGIKVISIGSDLRNGKTRSCGSCLRTRHGHTKNYKKSAEYQAWKDMRYRCASPKSKQFKDYGGRGITVCHQWRHFEVFLSDVGLRPSARYTLERINNNKGYCPDNVKWATRKEQANNTRFNHFLTKGQASLSLEDWAKRYTTSSNSIRYHLRKGLSVEKVLEYFELKCIKKASLADMGVVG